MTRTPVAEAGQKGPEISERGKWDEEEDDLSKATRLGFAALSVVQVILHIVSGAYLFVLQESRGEMELSVDVTLPTLHLPHSSSEMYSTAGSCLSFEGKRLKIKISNMTGKCIT